MRLLILLSLILTVISCSWTNEKLADNQTIKLTFDSDEINDLQKILTFFESQICKTENISSNNVKKCYESFFMRMEKAEETGNIDIKISFDTQLTLYEEIDSATFYQLWTFNRSWRRDSPDTLKSMTYNYNGKYVKFIKAFGEEDRVVNDYYESFQAVGDIGPNMVARILKMYKDYDTDDIRIRLLIAIHYLTMNDQYERKEKY